MGRGFQSNGVSNISGKSELPGRKWGEQVRIKVGTAYWVADMGPSCMTLLLPREAYETSGGTLTQELKGRQQEDGQKREHNHYAGT